MATRRHDTGGGAAARSAERERRDEAIRRARADGASLDELAGRWGIGRRQVQRILSGRRTPPPPVRAVAADPIIELEDVLTTHSQVLTELEELCQRTQHDGVKLGALRARADLATQRFAIFQHSPGLRNEAEARDLLDRFLRIVTARGDALPDDMARDFAALVSEFHPPATEEAAAA